MVCLVSPTETSLQGAVWEQHVHVDVLGPGWVSRAYRFISSGSLLPRWLSLYNGGAILGSSQGCILLGTLQTWNVKPVLCYRKLNALSNMDSHSAIFANCSLDCIYTVRNFTINLPFNRAGHYAYFLYTSLKILL